MVREIVKNPLILGQKSSRADRSDAGTVTDLTDTLNAHRDECVGMAANMIGVLKDIIVYDSGFGICVMVNPVIISRSKPYETEEGCLSLSGMRKTVRYDTIEVEYEDSSFKKRKDTFRGWTAEIIQHEIDHTNGIII